jgi:hypothetical protein
MQEIGLNLFHCVSKERDMWLLGQKNSCAKPIRDSLNIVRRYTVTGPYLPVDVLPNLACTSLQCNLDNIQ